MLVLRKAPQRRWIAGGVRLRPALPGALLLRAAAGRQVPTRRATLDAVALPGMAAARRARGARDAGGGRNAAARGAAPRRAARLRGSVGQGRRRQPHGFLQGTWAGGGSDPRDARGGAALRRPDGGQRRRGARSLRRPRGRGGTRGWAPEHTAHDPPPDPGAPGRTGPAVTVNRV